MLSNLVFYIIVAFLASVIIPSHAQSCKSYTFDSSITNKLSINTTSFKSCADLSVLSSFLHWNYNLATATLTVAYRHTGIPPATSKWVVWAINPTGSGMVGSQCLVAYRRTDGSMVSYTSPVNSYDTDLTEGPVSFNVTGLTAVSRNDEIIILAAIKLPSRTTTINQVWQDGPVSRSGGLKEHSTSGANMQSMASLNLVSDITSASQGGGGPSLKDIHGLINGVSWGIMMPIGAIVARHKAIFSDPAWFYIHMWCQLSAYIIGAAGWATGLKLGSDSGAVHYSHRNIGFALFCFGALQVSALLMRPKKDHKCRYLWNIYHHSIGYSTIIMSSINIFEGFEILNGDNLWKRAYIGAIFILAFIAVVLGFFSWISRCRRKSSRFGDDDPNKPNQGDTYVLNYDRGP